MGTTTFRFQIMFNFFFLKNKFRSVFDYVPYCLIIIFDYSIQFFVKRFYLKSPV